MLYTYFETMRNYYEIPDEYPPEMEDMETEEQE